MPLARARRRATSSFRSVDHSAPLPAPSAPLHRRQLRSRQHIVRATGPPLSPVLMTSATLLLLLVAVLSPPFPSSSALVLLADLPTPSFVVDVRALHRKLERLQRPKEGDGGAGAGSATAAIPALVVAGSATSSRSDGDRGDENDTFTLYPRAVTGGLSLDDDQTAAALLDGEAPKLDADVLEGDDPASAEAACAYLHSSVTRARDDADAGGADDGGLGEDDHHPSRTFLAEIDLTPSLCRRRNDNNEDRDDDEGLARLCLGLNNHHVGGYYWARSAGAGSSMDAPGVRYVSGDGRGVDGGDGAEEESRGILRWADEGGAVASNSNDGKRSEWCNFLRRGDTVQLVPASAVESLARFVDRYNMERGRTPSPSSTSSSSCLRVFGISSEGRPMGSDPAVVCEWRCW